MRLTRTPSPLLLAYTGIIATTFFWGSAFNVLAYVVRYMPPMTAAAERFVLASVLFCLIFGLSGKMRLSALRQNLLPYFLVGFFGVMGFNVAVFYGLHTTSALNAALIMATTPLTTLILASLVEKEKLTLFKAIGLLLGFLGVVLVISHGDFRHMLQLNIAVGDAMILAGSISFSIATIMSRRLVKHATALETTGFSMLFGALLLSLLSLIVEQPFHALAHTTLSVQCGLIYLAVFASMLAYLFWFNGIQLIGPAKTSTFFNLVPVCTMLVSIAVGTYPNFWQLAGTITVIVGVCFSAGLIKRRPASNLGVIYRRNKHG